MKKITVITKQAKRKFSSLSIPPPLTINCKLVEHALFEFSKYCRTSTQDLGANNKNQSLKGLSKTMGMMMLGSSLTFSSIGQEV